jgi:hypothetical protein
MYNIIFTNTIHEDLFRSIDKAKSFLNCLYDYLEYIPYNNSILVFRTDINRYLGRIEKNLEAKEFDDFIFKNKEEYDNYIKTWRIKNAPKWEEINL